jgi:hypothetical protein
MARGIRREPDELAKELAINICLCIASIERDFV